MTDALHDERQERRSLRLVEDLPEPRRQPELVANAERTHAAYLRGLATRGEAHAYVIGALREAVTDYDDDTRHWLDATVRGLIAALDATHPAPREDAP